MPYDRNPHFTGRSRLLDDLHRTLIDERVAVLNQIAAIAGLGGIGKTQTAVEYAYRYFYDAPTYEWVFWVTADTELALVTGLADVGRLLHLRDGTLEEVATQTKQWLMTHDRWLLIFDNADEPEVVKPWLPRNPRGRVLLTSRAQQFVRLGIKAPIVVPSLSLLDSIGFLFERTGRPVPVCEWATKTTDQSSPPPKRWRTSWTGCPWRWSKLPPTFSKRTDRLPCTGSTISSSSRPYWNEANPKRETTPNRSQPPGC